MSELKCPCCGRELEEMLDINDEPDYYECPDALCAFVCSARDLPRISAAMELAIATAAYFTLATEAGHKRLQEAGQRVLEVFK